MPCLLGERQLDRVGVRHRHPRDALSPLQDVHHAHVGQRGHRDARHALERVLILDRLAQDGAGLGQELEAGLAALEGGDVLEGGDHQVVVRRLAAQQACADQGPPIVG